MLLIEILSAGNEGRTRANIWTYTTIPSVREILAVHSTRMEVEVLRLGSTATLPESPAIVCPPDSLEPTSIGFAAAVEGLYRTAGLSA